MVRFLDRIPMRVRTSIGFLLANQIRERVYGRQGMESNEIRTDTDYEYIPRGVRRRRVRLC